MMNLALFSKPEFGQIRVAIIDGEPWFALTDVARAIGYGLDDIFALQKLCQSREVIEYDLRKCPDVTSGYSETKTGRGNPNAKFCNEFGLYRILFKSRKPACEAFQDWLATEVLPSIRKTGGYGASPSYMEDDPVKRARLWADEQEKLRKALSDAEAERDEAIRTKGQISSAREASIMGKLGHANAKVMALTAENADLRDQLGIGEKFKEVKAIPWLSEYFDMSGGKKTKDMYNMVGRKLSDLCRKCGFEKRTIESVEFRQVGAYSQEAIDMLKRLLDSDPTLLEKYRK